jgi:hypothetical protein
MYIEDTSVWEDWFAPESGTPMCGKTSSTGGTPWNEKVEYISETFIHNGPTVFVLFTGCLSGNNDVLIFSTF